MCLGLLLLLLVERLLGVEGREGHLMTLLLSFPPKWQRCKMELAHSPFVTFCLGPSLNEGFG